MTPPALPAAWLAAVVALAAAWLPPLTVLATWAASEAWAAAAWAAAGDVADDGRLGRRRGLGRGLLGDLLGQGPLDLVQGGLGEGAGRLGPLAGLVLDAQLGGLGLLLGQELGPGGGQLLLAGLHPGHVQGHIARTRASRRGRGSGSRWWGRRRAGPPRSTRCR